MYIYEPPKKQNIFRNCGLLCMIVISAVLFSVFGFLKKGSDVTAWSVDTPFLAAVFTEENDLMEDDLMLAQADGLGVDGLQDGELTGTVDASDGGALENTGNAGERDVSGNGTGQQSENGAGISANGAQIEQVVLGYHCDVDDQMHGPWTIDEIEIVNEEDLLQAQIDLELATPGRMLRVARFEDIAPWTARSAYYDDGDKKPLTTLYPYVEVDASYYDDALFIGDSRIEGLHDYGGLDNATFAYKTGLSVFKIQEETLYIVKGKDVKTGSLKKAVQSGEYKKIFLMIGVNELGKGYSYQYVNKYIEVVEEIRSYAPDAVLEVMGIMYVSKNKSDSSDVFNNDNINCRNTKVMESMPEDDAIIYLDMNACVIDEETGMLNGDYTNDGLHLSAKYYYLWVDWLNAHGLQNEMFR